MSTTICFECKQEIEVPRFTIQLRSGGYIFHPSCARQIIARHVESVLQYEADLENRAAQADRLNYVPSADTWKCSVCLQSIPCNCEAGNNPIVIVSKEETTK